MKFDLPKKQAPTKPPRPRPQARLEGRGINESFSRLNYTVTPPISLPNPYLCDMYLYSTRTIIIL